MTGRSLLPSVTLIAIVAPLLALGPTDAFGQYDSVEVNGITMAYQVIGQGEPLVMLHGYMGSSADWDPLLEEFSAHYRLIVPDARGHGRSSFGSEPLSFYQHASDVEALLDHLGIESVKGIGFSLGAMVLMHMATQHPERVEAMVMMSGSPYFPQAVRDAVVSGPRQLSPEVTESLGRAHRGGAKQVRQLMAAIKEYYTVDYDDMSFTPPLLSTITARTLIIHGDRDWAFPVSIPVGLYESIPESYLWIVPNGDHDPFPQSEPALSHFKATVLAFFAGEWN